MLSRGLLAQLCRGTCWREIKSVEEEEQEQACEDFSLDRIDDSVVRINDNSNENIDSLLLYICTKLEEQHIVFRVGNIVTTFGLR